MRKRIHKVANFLAFNLLFFALYLNFIYKDPAASTEKIPQEATAAFSGINEKTPPPAPDSGKTETSPKPAVSGPASH